MASITEDVSLKFMTTKDGDLEETSFSAGDEVEIVETWDEYFLIKCDDGHFYNVAKNKVEE